MRKRRKIISKNMIEVLDYHTALTYRKNRIRAPKVNPTSEEVRRQNEKNAEAQLRLLIDNNFLADDHYITLTYKEQPSLAEAKKDIMNFLRRVKYKYKKAGQELKYIYIVEGRKRIHFHLLINNVNVLSVKTIKEIWGHGLIDLRAYQGEATDAEALASYFVKEKKSGFYDEEVANVFKRRWTPSKNLKKPAVKVETLSAHSWKKDIKAPAGYYVDKLSVIEGISLAGYPYRFYRLIKIKNHQTRRKKE